MDASRIWTLFGGDGDGRSVYFDASDPPRFMDLGSEFHRLIFGHKFHVAFPPAKPKTPYFVLIPGGSGGEVGYGIHGNLLDNFSCCSGGNPGSMDMIVFGLKIDRSRGCVDLLDRLRSLDAINEVVALRPGEAQDAGNLGGAVDQGHGREPVGALNDFPHGSSS